MTSTSATLFDPAELRDRLLAKLNVESKDLSTKSRGCLDLFMDILGAPDELQNTINLLLEDHKQGLANSPVVHARSSPFEDMFIMQPPLFVEAMAPNMPAVQPMKMTTATIGWPPSVTKAEMEKLAPFMEAMLDSATVEWFSNVDQDTTVVPEPPVPERKYPLQEVKVAASAGDPPDAALSDSSLPSDESIIKRLAEMFQTSDRKNTTGKTMSITFFFTFCRQNDSSVARRRVQSQFERPYEIDRRRAHASYQRGFGRCKK